MGDLRKKVKGERINTKTNSKVETRNKSKQVKCQKSKVKEKSKDKSDSQQIKQIKRIIIGAEQRVCPKTLVGRHSGATQ